MFSDDDITTIARIVKVNHAGEYGASRIYGAQLLIAKFRYPELLPFLSGTRKHEVEHCYKFREAMPQRMVRPCRAMWFWSVGGWLLGAITACLGRNAVMVCTAAVERTVHRHLEDQLRFLKDRDAALHQLIGDIQKEEIEHLEYAEKMLKPGALVKPLSAFVVVATDVIIWLSTQGDVTRMKHAVAD